MLDTNRTWYSVELKLDDAEIFREYLVKAGIKYEPSGCYNLVHFECYMTKEERKAANEFLQKSITIEGCDDCHE